MPPARKTAPADKQPRRRAFSSEELNAMIEQVTPAVLALLADGVPRRKAAIITALGDRHPKDEVTRTLMRLAVLGQLVEQGDQYRLAGVEPEADRAEPRR